MNIRIRHGREDDAQRLGGPHLMLELAAPFQVDAFRQLHLLGHDALGLFDEADHVAVAANVERDVVAQPAVLTLNHRRPFGDAHVRHFGEREFAAARRRPRVPGR